MELIQGELISRNIIKNRFYKRTSKGLVKTISGKHLYGTLPDHCCDSNIGDTIAFTAMVSMSDDTKGIFTAAE